jgi:Sec-independent protein translocase protein TatA
MIFGLGIGEILLILAIVALIFGPTVFVKARKTANKTRKAFQAEIDDKE